MFKNHITEQNIKPKMTNPFKIGENGVKWVNFKKNDEKISYKNDTWSRFYDTELRNKNTTAEHGS